MKHPYDHSTSSGPGPERINRIRDAEMKADRAHYAQATDRLWAIELEATPRHPDGRGPLEYAFDLIATRRR